MRATISAKYLPLLIAFSGKKDVRLWMNQSVRIEAATIGGVYLVSTDGMRLIVIHDAEGETDEDVLLQFELPVIREAKHADRAILDGKRCKLTALVGDDDVTDGGEIFLTGNAARLDAPFPKWRDVMPSPSFKDWSVGVLDIRLLRPLEKAPWPKRAPRTCAMYVRKDGAAIVRPLALKEIYALVMPIHLEGTDPMPSHVAEWLQ